LRKTVAGIGGDDAARGPVEQFSAKFLFKQLHRFCECRMRHAELAGGAAKTLVAINRDEPGQSVQIYIHVPIIT